MTHESKSPVQLVVGAVAVLCAAGCFAMDITTSDGKTYHDVTVTRAEADGLVITHSGGAGKVPFLELPKDIREKYGYDPAKAEAARAKAEASKKAAASAWQDMDQRMVFFTVQLSSVEASIAAINRALTMLGYQQSNRKFDANTARQANTTMDRYGGGPVQWEEFYGRTAEKFFYHPTDRNTSYHTQTVLGQKPPEWDNATGPGVPSRQGLPVHQRPPQFDYIYRGNSDAEKRAMEEVARIGNNVEALLQRRRQLEAEQSALWSKIAFHAVTGRELLNKPLYYCDLTSAEPGEGRARVEAMRAAMDYLRNANKLAAMVEQGVEADAARCYSQLQEGAAAARGEMERRLMAQPAASGEMADRQTALGQLTAVAKRMNEITANIADAYRLALDGDQAGDQGRKLTFRSQLQQSLMLCAEALLAGDECVNDLAKDWKVQPATQTTAPASTTVQASLVVPPPRPGEKSESAQQNGKSSDSGVTAGVSAPAIKARDPVSAKGLVLHYDFAQEEPGGKISDTSELGNHGQVTGARWISTKGNGGAYEFAAGDDVIRPPNNDYLNCEHITVSAWIKTSCLDNKGWRRVFLKSWDKGYTLCIIGDWREFKSRGFIRFVVASRDVESRESGHFTDSDMSIADGQWHHIAATYDGEIQWLYVDGKPQSGPKEWKGKVLPTKVGLTVGNCMAPSSGEVFQGAIGELMIYSRALSAEEISLLYSSQKMKYPPDSASAPIPATATQSPAQTVTSTSTTPEALKEALAACNPGYQRNGNFQVRDGTIFNIDLANTEIRDIAPLKGLKLESLNLFKTKVEDISPIKEMPLHRLILRNCSMVRDFSPLAGMPLTFLDVGGCPHFKDSDLACLKGSPLEALKMGDTEVRDLFPLEGMPLRELNLNSSHAVDYKPLAGLPLYSLMLQGASFGNKDLALLRGRPIEVLNLANTRVTNLSPLEGMPIEDLTLNGTRVVDFRPLAGLHLNILNLFGTDFGDNDLALLRGLPISELQISHTHVTNLSPLKGMPLKRLDVSHTAVSDISVLKDLPLEWLFLNHTKVTNISALKGKHLKRLTTGGLNVPDAEIKAAIEPGVSP